MASCDGINKGVHDCVEHNHRQGIALVYSHLKVEGVRLPGLGGDDSFEVLVQVADHVNHCLGSMIMLQGEMDEIMVNAAEGISKVEPADAEGLVLFAGLTEDG